MSPIPPRLSTVCYKELRSVECVGVISCEVFYQQVIQALVSKWQNVINLETRKVACRVIIDFKLECGHWQLIPLGILN
jgi:hypothetical protein